MLLHPSRGRSTSAIISADTRRTLDKYLPLLLGLLAALFIGKTLKKTLWSAFVLYLALHYSGIHPFD